LTPEEIWIACVSTRAPGQNDAARWAPALLLFAALWKVEGLLSIAEKMKLDSELCEKMLRHHAAPVTSATILKKIDFYYLFSHNA